MHLDLLLDPDHDRLPAVHRDPGEGDPALRRPGRHRRHPCEHDRRSTSHHRSPHRLPHLRARLSPAAWTERVGARVGGSSSRLTVGQERAVRGCTRCGNDLITTASPGSGSREGLRWLHGGSGDQPSVFLPPQRNRYARNWCIRRAGSLFCLRAKTERQGGQLSRSVANYPVQSQLV